MTKLYSKVKVKSEVRVSHAVCVNFSGVSNFHSLRHLRMPCLGWQIFILFRILNKVHSNQLNGIQETLTSHQKKTNSVIKEALNQELEVYLLFCSKTRLSVAIWRFSRLRQIPATNELNWSGNNFLIYKCQINLYKCGNWGFLRWNKDRSLTSTSSTMTNTTEQANLFRLLNTSGVEQKWHSARKHIIPVFFKVLNYRKFSKSVIYF